MDSGQCTTATLKGRRQPAAVVFDCDGVLVDTTECWTAARAAIYTCHGQPFDVGDDREARGTGVLGTARVLSRTLDEPELAADLARELQTLLVAQVERRPLRPLPGARELVEQVKARMPVAVASNAPRAVLTRILASAHLAELFDVSLSADDVTRPKPAPDLYLAACRKLGSPPATTIAFEDSPAGAASARAAGLYVIGVAERRVGGAHETIGSLVDPRLSARLGLLPR